MKFKKSFLKVAGAAMVAGLATAAPAAAAVELPCTTAKLIVPWGPGGGTSVIFGIFEQAIQASDAKVKIKVVTVPGQGGALGAKEAAAAKPDGCTLFAIHQHMVVNYINGVTDFNWDEFEPVALLTDTPEIIGAGSHVEYSDLEGMLAAAKASPGDIPTGVSMGATSHFLWLMLGAKTGTDFAYVPFQGGTAGRVTGLLNGTIDLGGINMAAARTQRGDGGLKAFAIAAEERSDLIPDVPTLKELGIDMNYSLTRGIMLPKGTPKEIVDFWASVFKGPTEDADFVAQQAAKGTAVLYKGPAEYAEWWEETSAEFLDAAKKIKVGRFQ
ncbi:tripartite tricarboxylate transporter substrate binding protein [Candidatus Halocynthiibacter alkanivorans]|jgi:putative tricarboxylic transport membrane protein|uniref:tripartite tricarboxylate transporter substrate binding protein n=1 Tax=Candidatus Halocynthiibacter alkanivorans TaxID=2267619 RepID=UPI00135CAF68|nr:tripartite tricarboxylate transporter substrate binding protein [Candidatus Halocynthiibacter alkanivorans]